MPRPRLSCLPVAFFALLLLHAARGLLLSPRWSAARAGPAVIATASGRGANAAPRAPVCRNDVVASLGDDGAGVAMARPDRRAFLKSVPAVALALGGAWASPSSSQAAEKADNIEWDTEFGVVREAYEEFIGPLETGIEEGNWEVVLSMTRQQDSEFRKRLMGELRKKLPSSNRSVKDEAQSLMNAVSFDFIAINKAARTSNAEKVRELLPILKEDIIQFLALEPRIYG